MDQIFNICKQNPKQTLAFIIFVCSNIKNFQYLLIKKKVANEYEQLKTKKIYSGYQILRQVEKQNKNSSILFQRQYLLKVYPNNERFQNYIQIQKQVHSNEMWVVQPSIKRIGRQVNELLNHYQIHNDKKTQDILQKLNLKRLKNWSAFTYLNDQRSKVQIKGFGQLCEQQQNSLFNITYKTKTFKDRGFFSALLQNISYFFQIIFFFFLQYDQNNNRRIHQQRQSFIKGPVIGMISYLFNFVTNRPILIHAKIQDGVILPLMISTSRQKMLKHCENKIYQQQKKIILFSVVGIISYIFCAKLIRKMYLIIKTKIIADFFGENKEQKKYKRYNPSIQELNQDKLCIICYTNCRNVIVFGCRHFIMCSQCKQALNNHQCPLCKNQIEVDKVLYQNNEKQIPKY